MSRMKDLEFVSGNKFLVYTMASYNLGKQIKIGIILLLLQSDSFI